jgi:hypothetical protein
MTEQETRDMLEMAWVVLANVSEGAWHEQNDSWIDAVTEWRDHYFSYLAVTS